LLPLGLAPGAVLVTDVAEGTLLRYSDVELNESLAIVQLRRLQDRMVAGG
jgi:predicted homoserine dehydrogenase-like protein